MVSHHLPDYRYRHTVYGRSKAGTEMTLIYGKVYDLCRCPVLDSNYITKY